MSSFSNLIHGISVIILVLEKAKIWSGESEQWCNNLLKKTRQETWTYLVIVKVMVTPYTSSPNDITLPMKKAQMNMSSQTYTVKSYHDSTHTEWFKMFGYVLKRECILKTINVRHHTSCTTMSGVSSVIPAIRYHSNAFWKKKSNKGISYTIKNSMCRDIELYNRNLRAVSALIYMSVCLKTLEMWTWVSRQCWFLYSLYLQILSDIKQFPSININVFIYQMLL